MRSGRDLNPIFLALVFVLVWVDIGYQSITKPLGSVSGLKKLDCCIFIPEKLMTKCLCNKVKGPN